MSHFTTLRAKRATFIIDRFYESKSILSTKIDLIKSQIPKVFKFTQHCLICIKKVKNNLPIGENKFFKIWISARKNQKYVQLPFVISNSYQVPAK